MESNTIYGDSMVKLVCRLSGVLCREIWSIKSSNNLHINFDIKSPKTASLSILISLIPGWTAYSEKYNAKALTYRSTERRSI